MKSEGSKERIEQRLGAVRTKIRRVQWVRGALVTACVFLGGLLVMMAVDLALAPTPQAARWALFAAWMAAILVAVKKGFGPLFRKIGLIQIARWLEGRHPEIEERMSTALEISGGSGASEELMAALIHEAGEDVGRVDPEVEVNAARTSRKWLRPVIALTAVILIGLVIWPQEASRLIARAVAPFSDIGNVGAARFEVEPGDVELLEGDPVEIGIGYDGAAEAVELVIELESGGMLMQPTILEDGKHIYRQEPVRETFRYRARAGRDESDFWTATVWPLPRLLDSRVRLSYPAYTGLLPDEGSIGRRVEAVVGTELRLEGKTNTPVESGWIELAGKRRVEGGVSASGGPVTFETVLTAEDSGEAAVWLHHRLGRDVEALRFELRVLPDKAPKVVWLKPSRKEIRVRPDELLDLRYEATEDFGLARVVLEVGKDDKTGLSQDLPEKVAGSKPPRFRGSIEAAVGMLRERLDGAREFELRLRVEDARPAEADGPGRGFTDWLIVKIDEGAESLARQELRAEHEEARDTLNEAIRATQEARDRMDWNRDRLIKNERTEESIKLANETRERLAAAAEKLEELAPRMEESVHAAKADPLREAAELVEKAQEDFDQVPLQDDQQQRQSKLEEAKNEAQEAIRKLEAVRDAVNRDQPKIDDLARLEELAQQQRELARQAEEMNPQEAVSEPWMQKQDQVEEAIRQQLRERPEALEVAQRTQAEKARALAEKARELAKDQKNLQQQAAESAQQGPAEQSLREALAKEQAEIAEEAGNELAKAREERSAMADLMPEAAKAAEKAAQALQQNESPAAATREAGEALKQAAMEAAKPQSAPDQNPAAKSADARREETLAELAGRQEQVAKAVEALEQGNATQALEQLQAMKADQGGELAGELSSVPRIDGSPLQEATDHANQAKGHAEAAAAVGATGMQEAAAGEHGRTEEKLNQVADALDRAAKQLDEQAAQAAQGQSNENQAPADPGQLAEALAEASMASEGKSQSSSAGHAGRAAQALSKAAQAGRQAMQGRSPGKPGAPGPPGNQPGRDPMAGPRPAQADPGVPPELAKLGINAEDWEKIRQSLKSDVGASGAGGVPEDYRGLVKDYFETMAREK